MPDHPFLCGLDASQAAAYKGGRTLNLHGSNPNVRLKLDDIRKGLLKTEPELLTDLIEIAAYVFAADCSVPRGGPTFPQVGAKWRRCFHLVIAVRDPGRWSAPQLLDALKEALEFLSDDAWHFTFEQLNDPPALLTYLTFADRPVESVGDTAILLFSGGLDSFAGAVHHLTTTNRHVVLMSRRLQGMTDSRQDELAGVIKCRSPKRVTHVTLQAGLTKETAAREHTQRTRSFLLAAMALVAAVMEGADRIKFYENGVMSVNLPISTQVVGTRASRSTHPRSLMLLERIGRLIAAPAVQFENPFLWMTKAEVVAGLLPHPESRSIARTVSCSRTREMTIAHPHCGRCAQCLQRSISTRSADTSQYDPQIDYAVDLLLGARQSTEDRTMASETIRSALDCWRMSEREFAVRFAGELAWLTMDCKQEPPDVVTRKCFDLFKRHGETVHAIFVRAHQQHAQEIFDQTLPDSCLLRLVPNSLASLEMSLALEERPAPLDTAELIESDEVSLAIDTTEKKVRINCIAPLSGATDFRLLSVLATMHLEDRENGLLPANYRTLSGDALADSVSCRSDQAARKAVERVRKHIADDWRKVFCTDLCIDAVVENVPRKGYRLNPRVRIVSPDQLRR